VLAELGMVFADPRYPLGTARVTPDRPRSRTSQSRSASAWGSRSASPSARLLDVVFDVGEAAAAGGLGPLGEHLSRVAERDRLPCFSGDQVERVELAAGVGEELERDTACP
jgi:hypothetical protein